MRFSALRGLLLIYLIQLASFATKGATEVTGQEILAKVRAEHPRLIMTPPRLALLKTNHSNDPWLREQYNRQRRKAQRLFREPVNKYDLKGGDALLEVSRRVLDRVATLAIVYRVEGGKNYLERCWAELDAAAHFKDWHPGHFLDTAEMTAAFAIGYDWLYDNWSDDQRRVLRQAIVELGLKPGLSVYRSRERAFPSVVNNWNVVCNGGLALGALAVAKDAPDVAGEVLARGLASVPRCLAQFGPDGAWPEGPMYWSYATLYEAMYLDALETACGSDFGLADIPGVDKAGWFPLYCNGQADGSFNFADADEEPAAGPQLLWMAQRFHEPRYGQYQVEKATGRLSALDLLWRPGLPLKAWQTIEPDKYFRGVEVATMRDGWDDTNSWFVGFKAGSNAVTHSHLDIGSFVLEAKGVRWAIDLGPDDYDLPGYWDHQQRWTYYRMRAEGHNTLVINPGMGPDQDPKGAGKITSFAPTARGVDLTADLTGAYPLATQVVRSLSFVRGKSAELSDLVKLSAPGEIWWFLQTRAEVNPVTDARTLTLTQNRRTLTVRLLKPDGARFETCPAKPLPTSPHPPNQAANEGITRIAVHLSGVQETEISARFE